MKKFLKISAISLTSLILLILIVVSILLWIIFTPKKLTPIIEKQLNKYIEYPTKLSSVELTFFSTFPHFGLKVDDFSLDNHISDNSCTPLLDVKQVIGIIDVEAFLRRDELILSDFQLKDGSICLYVDSLGNSNFNLFPSDPNDTTSSGINLEYIDIRNVELYNVNVIYKNEQAKNEAFLENFSAKLKGSLKKNDIIYIKAETDPFNISYSNHTNKLIAHIENFSTKIDASLKGDELQGILEIKPFNVSLEYENEKYLNNSNIQLSVIAKGDLSRNFFEFENLSATINNNLPIQIIGNIEIDTTKNIISDISYTINSWQIKDVLDLIPNKFKVEYLNGITADGKISSKGSIIGIFNDSIFPLLDVGLLLENGKLTYSEIPFPISDINGDLHIYTDLKDDKLSHIDIKSLSAHTPQSAISTRGQINNLFSNIHPNLNSKLNIALSEVNLFIPDSMKIDISGKINGVVNSDFTLSQIQNMELEKLKLSGSLTLNDIDAKYDSIYVKTNLANVNFALPNNNPTTKHTQFLVANIYTDLLDASMIDGFNASIKNGSINIETSDVRDTTHIPAISLLVKTESLQAQMDTINIAVSQPDIMISVSPQRRNAEQPRFRVIYNSGNVLANMGENHLNVEKIDLKTTVFYNDKEEDLFSKFSPRGFVDIKNTNILTPLLNYVVEVPSIKMEINPKEFTIEKLALKLDKSDFNLSGKLSNILPYFRGDSILRGSFDFNSNHADIIQLMNMTSGIGTEGANKAEDLKKDNSSFSGPYMVPEGIDIVLHTNVKKATYAQSNFNNIIGDITIKNGALVLDDLKFDSEPATMELTAIYKTPRKNHLELGLDLHMYEIEIKELLSLIPDLDSIMPMLKSFDGRAEFHFAFQTFLDSLYNLKMSTLRGAGSIQGVDLVVLDGETFSKISKKLLFKNKERNIVDSLSAEFTIFRNEIDVYPFLIVMDRYKAIVGGRHNLDMSYDYNISLIKSPLPFRISVEVKTNPKPKKNGKLMFRLRKGKYPEFYRPAERLEVQNNKLELRRLIRETLTSDSK